MKWTFASFGLFLCIAPEWLTAAQLPRPSGSILVASASAATRHLFEEMKSGSARYRNAEQTAIQDAGISIAEFWWEQQFSADTAAAHLKPATITFDPPGNIVGASAEAGYMIRWQLVGAIRGRGFTCNSLLGLGGEMTMGSETWGVVCDGGAESYSVYFSDGGWWLVMDK